METDTVGPALTPEEWAEVAEVTDPAFALTELRIERDVEDAPHAAAAIYLHGQPFGFTWEMHDALRFCAARTRAHDGPSGTDGNYAALCDEAADRIAALLPPRE